MYKVEKGGCPFYKYRPADGADILGCTATGEYIPVSVSDSKGLSKMVDVINETCLGFDYPKCPHYKKGCKG